MTRKGIVVMLCLGLFMILIFGNTMAGQTEEVDGSYDTAYYVEANGNLILKIAKIIDKGCFYVVDIFVSGIGSIFNSIIGN